MENLFNGGNDTITPIDRVTDHVTYSLYTACNSDKRGLLTPDGECEDEREKNVACVERSNHSFICIIYV